MIELADNLAKETLKETTNKTAVPVTDHVILNDKPPHDTAILKEENKVSELREETVIENGLNKNSDKMKLSSSKLNSNTELNNFLESLAKETETSLSYIKFLKSLTEQDKTLPLNNVANIMKSVLPEGTKVSKDAKQLMQDCCSELISFITSEATEIVSTDKRKTVMGDDIISSLYCLGFENYGEIMKIYLQKYREFQLLKQLVIGLMEEENSEGKFPKKQKRNPK